MEIISLWKYAHPFLFLNQTVTLRHHYVRPSSEDGISETVITEECKAQTQLPEDRIKNAQLLEHVLEEVSFSIYNLLQQLLCTIHKVLFVNKKSSCFQENQIYYIYYIYSNTY